MIITESRKNLNLYTLQFLKIFNVLTIFGDALCHPMFPPFKAVFEFLVQDVPQNCVCLLLDSSDIFEPLTFQCKF